MASVLAVLEQICRSAGTTVVFLHHVSKAAALTGAAGEQQASRGSSVLTDNVRWQANLATMGEREAKAARIADDQRRRYVRLAWPKVNYGPPVSDLWFSREKGGVLRPAPHVSLLLSSTSGGPARPEKKKVPPTPPVQPAGAAKRSSAPASADIQLCRARDLKVEATSDW